MPRLQTLFVIICLLIVSVQPASGQYEKEAGKLLFKNALAPTPAGPGKVAFLRGDPKHPAGEIELYLGDMKTLTETRVLPGVGFGKTVGTVFAWSPDGGEFVIPQQVNGCWELFRYKLGSRTGEQISKLIQFKEERSQEIMELQELTPEELLRVGPMAYSPSGKRIIFLLDRPGKAALWWIDPLTGNTRQATEDQVGYHGCFAPDDEHISYTLTRRTSPTTMSDNEDIVIRSLATGKVDTLAGSSAMESAGTISPDGKYLAYVVTTAGINNLWVMNLATKESRQFTFATKGKQCTSPKWTPDGRQIVFAGIGFLPESAAFVKDFVPF